MNIYTRFLAKVETHGMDAERCWFWKGAGKGNGYGHFSISTGRTEHAHRASHVLFIGPIPKGKEVCHVCDNRACVNPDHLFLGTRAENMADMVAKGRGAGGSRKNLKESTVQEIRRRIHAGVPKRRIAESLNVNYGTVTAIARGDSYDRIGK